MITLPTFRPRTSLARRVVASMVATFKTYMQILGKYTVADYEPGSLDMRSLLCASDPKLWYGPAKPLHTRKAQSTHLRCKQNPNMLGGDDCLEHQRR